MKDFSKATPRPWHEGAGNGEGSIFSENGRMRFEDRHGTVLYPIANIITGWKPEEDSANEELIVHAVNHFEELLDFVDTVAMGNTDPDRLAEIANDILSRMKGA